MKMLRFLGMAVFLPAFLLVGCAGTPQNTASSTPVTPVGATGNPMIDRALARESSLARHYPVGAEDGFFTATVPAGDTPRVQAFEGVYQVSIPMGAEEPAECFVYTDVHDSASTLSKLIDEPLAEMPHTKILAIDAGAFGKRPFLYEEKLYLTDDRMAGALKGYVVSLRDSLLACMHDTAGYRDTFRQVVAGLADTLQLRDVEPREWQHESVLVWTMHDRNIGYTLTRAIPAAGGEIRSTVETAMMMPRSASETLTFDEYSVTYELPDGTLVYGRYAEAENGKVKVSMSLDSKRGRDYRVSGQFQGKPVDAAVASGGVIAGPYFQHREMIRAAHPERGQPGAIELVTYVPTVNPLETITMEMQPTGKQVDGLPEYELAFAGLRATGTIDAQGQKAMQVQMGQLELQLTRAFSHEQH